MRCTLTVRICCRLIAPSDKPLSDELYQRRGRNRVGITLVELLATIVLSTLLMASVLGVLASVTKGQRVVLANHGIPDSWQTRLSEILAWDLENSRTIQNTESGVRFEGFAGRDLSNRTPIHCPCVIDYQVTQIGKWKCLIRTESHTDLLDTDNQCTDLVCLGVEKLIIGPPVDAASVSANPDSVELLPDGPLPNRVCVTLFSTSQSNPLFSQTFTLR